jgi:hypothetical protein
VGSKLNVGVTRMWKYFSWDFRYGHRHCVKRPLRLSVSCTVIVN